MKRICSKEAVCNVRSAGFMLHFWTESKCTGPPPLSLNADLDPKELATPESKASMSIKGISNCVMGIQNGNSFWSHYIHSVKISFHTQIRRQSFNRKFFFKIFICVKPCVKFCVNKNFYPTLMVVVEYLFWIYSPPKWRL